MHNQGLQIVWDNVSVRHLAQWIFRLSTSSLRCQMSFALSSPHATISSIFTCCSLRSSGTLFAVLPLFIFLSLSFASSSLFWSICLFPLTAFPSLFSPVHLATVADSTHDHPDACCSLSFSFFSAALDHGFVSLIRNNQKGVHNYLASQAKGGCTFPVFFQFLN